MKKLYWTSHQLHTVSLSIMCFVALLCLYVVESNKQLVPQPHYQLKLEAAQLSMKAFEQIKKRRLKMGIRINPKFDPAKTGLIGAKNSEITSDHGVLRAKQISLDPNLAGIIVQWLKDLSLKEGDVVAVGMTGSFPALDISTLAAIHTMKLQPLVIVSASSSNWGANILRFNVLDMIHQLNTSKVIPYKPIGVSIGASKDLGKNLNETGISTIMQRVKKYNHVLIKEPTVSESIEKRLDLYNEGAGENSIKAYINVGGGVASIGKHYSKVNLSKDQKEAIANASLPIGVNRDLPVALANTNSVSIRFLKEGVPVINIKNIGNLAIQYDLLPWQGGDNIGVGSIFFHDQYNTLLAVISLLIICLVCWFGKISQYKRKKQEAEEGVF